MTPDAIRRKNFISPRAMPYKTATGKVYDFGDFAAHLKRAMEIADWKEFPKRAKAAKKQGLVRGIGLASYVEVCGAMGEETAKVQLDPNGDVTDPDRHPVDRAGPPDRLRAARRRAVRPGAGAHSRRSGRHRRDRHRSRHRRLRLDSVGRRQRRTGDARAWQETEGDRRRGAGDQCRRSRDQRGQDPNRRHRPLGQLCRSGQAARCRCRQADASATFASADGTYPNGTHLAEVEIDPATGIVKIVNYVIVDDFGVTLNPLLLAGQVHGGAMQGIGQALMEQVVYSPGDAQLVTATYMDYALPRAADGPSFVFETHNVPCKTNPLGVKGAGEAGAIGSCPAVVNAIIDGLWREYKIDHIDMPATPERVWVAIREQHRRHSL